LVFCLSNSFVGRVLPDYCGRFTLHVLVLTVRSGEVGLELCPSFVSKWFFVPPATGAHEVPICKYFGIANVDLLWFSNKNAPCLRVIVTILNLLEQGFNRLLRIPCSPHVFKVDFKIHRGDVAVSAEYMVKHVPSRDAGKTNHAIIQKRPSTLVQKQ
jgi:hypothetical protein